MITALELRCKSESERDSRLHQLRLLSAGTNLEISVYHPVSNARSSVELLKILHIKVTLNYGRVKKPLSFFPAKVHNVVKVMKCY